MENIFVEFLPPWIETGLQPAFYDKESGTSLQQTARMYARVNMLIRMFNKLSKNTKTVVEDYINQFNELHDYVHDYFDNLDVQEEINNKLDAMAEDGTLTTLIKRYIDPIVEEQDDRIDAGLTQINTIAQNFNQLVNSNPIPVSSTSAMTDHSKIYLNTTNGKWYYYDSTQSGFVEGGTYQSTVSTGITDANVNYKGLTPSTLAHYTNQTISGTDPAQTSAWAWDGYGIQANGTCIAASGLKSVRCLLPRNSFVTISRSVVTNRFKVGLAQSKPAVGTTTTVINEDATKSYVSFFTGNIPWVVVQYTSNNESCDISVKVENVDKLMHDIGAENLIPFVPVTAGTNLYNPLLKKNGFGSRTPDMAWKEDTTLSSYIFGLTRNNHYTVVRNGGNRMRVCLWNEYPKTMVSGDDTNFNYLDCRPAKIVETGDSVTTVEFDSETYKYCTITYGHSYSTPVDASFVITTDYESYTLSPQWYTIPDILNNGIYVFNPEILASDDYWTMWSGRLAFGMNTNVAPVPVQIESQLFVDGTIIAHNNSESNTAGGYNRWGMHLYEGYSRDDYSRMTLLVDKHSDEFGDSKKSCEQYYYTGAGHKASDYGNMKLGSDVKSHSFAFNRDIMTASGVIDCLYPVQLARIDTENDLDDTYQTVAEADSAHEPESDADANISCLKWIYLHNATDGAMFYDSARNKLVVKINGSWCDVQTTPVAEGTYNF